VLTSNQNKKHQNFLKFLKILLFTFDSIFADNFSNSTANNLVILLSKQYVFTLFVILRTGCKRTKVKRYRISVKII